MPKTQIFKNKIFFIDWKPATHTLPLSGELPQAAATVSRILSFVYSSEDYDDQDTQLFFDMITVGSAMVLER